MTSWNRSRASRYRAGVVALRAVLTGALGASLTVEGIRNLPDGPAVFATNHLSYIDAFTVGLALQDEGRTPIFMVRSQLADSWLIGGFLRSGAVLVDSTSAEASKATWDEAIGHLEEGRDLILAPEHAISRSLDLLPFKSGAVRIARRANVPLVPIANFGSQRFFTRNITPKFRPAYGIPLSVNIGTPLHTDQGTAVNNTDRLRTDLEALLERTLDSYPDREQGEAGAAWWPCRRGGDAISHDVAMAGHAIDTAEEDPPSARPYVDVQLLDEVAAALNELETDDQDATRELVADLHAAADQLGTFVDNPADVIASMLSTLNLGDGPSAVPELGDMLPESVQQGVKAARPPVDDRDRSAEAKAFADEFRLVLVNPDDDLLDHTSSISRNVTPLRPADRTPAMRRDEEPAGDQPADNTAAAEPVEVWSAEPDLPADDTPTEEPTGEQPDEVDAHNGPAENNVVVPSPFVDEPAAANLDDAPEGQPDEVAPPAATADPSAGASDGQAATRRGRDELARLVDEADATDFLEAFLDMDRNDPVHAPRDTQFSGLLDDTSEETEQGLWEHQVDSR